MSRVNYIYKKESNIYSFTNTSSTIELKPYMDDLIFYSPMNNLYRAEYCLYDKLAKFDDKPEVFTGGPFGSYLKIKDSYKFDLNNFDELNDNARISFYLGTNKLVESTKVSLKAKDNFPKEGLPAGSYSFSVAVDGQPTSTMTIKLKDRTSIAELKNKILFKLNPVIYPFELNVINNEEDIIMLQSIHEGKTMKVVDGLDGINLLDYFDVINSEFGSSPTKEVEVFKLFNLSITHFKNIKKGNDESYLRFKLSGTGDSSNELEQIIEVPWNSDSIHLDNIEIDFDDNLVYIFINGKMVKIEMLKTKFSRTEQTLELCGLKSAQYSFDEIIINKKCIHTKDFELPKKQLTKYSVEKPYIDFHYSGVEVKKGMELKTFMQSGIHCSICDDGNFYHWSAGSWRRCDGTYSHSNDWDTFSEKIKEFEYTGNDFFIRAFFFSDGVANSFINVPFFEMNEELYEDKNGNIAAILVGDKEWSKDCLPIMEELLNKKLVITTDQGTTEIDFIPTDEEIAIWNEKNNIGNYDGSDDSSYDIHEFNMDLKWVIEKINSYYPDGIMRCEKDTKERCILISETKGEDAYIILKGDAAEIIFGHVHYAKGSNANSGTIDYTEFYNAVRTYTGSPLISMEITDDMMRMYLKEALNYYKRWRGDSINSYTCQLKGDWQNGYEIPSVIETQKDIIDIIFKPIFPITFYGSDFIANGSENIFTLTIAQSLFGGRHGMRQAQGITQDFYISLIGMQDFRQALGLNPTWEIMNNRIFIYPSSVSRFTNVAIRYKAPLSEEECLKDPDIIKYVHGKCLMTMGNIRGQYGANLNNGDMALQFNADALYERGKAFVDEVIQLWMKMQPPTGFFLG